MGRNADYGNRSAGGVQLLHERIAFPVVEVVVHKQEVETVCGQRSTGGGQAGRNRDRIERQKLADDISRKHRMVFNVKDVHCCRGRIHADWRIVISPSPQPRPIPGSDPIFDCSQ